jgi:hypothetical protein
MASARPAIAAPFNFNVQMRSDRAWQACARRSQMGEGVMGTRRGKRPNPRYRLAPGLTERLSCARGNYAGFNDYFGGFGFWEALRMCQRT